MRLPELKPYTCAQLTMEAYNFRLLLMFSVGFTLIFMCHVHASSFVCLTSDNLPMKIQGSSKCQTVAPSIHLLLSAHSTDLALC
jgi:hypothetical protein